LGDTTHLGVLSSGVHTAWALAAGGWLGVGNDPVYVKSRCFETFPFPSAETGLTPALSERIRSIAVQLDAHRKSRLAEHTKLTLTGIYNVLEKLRAGEQLTLKEKSINEDGLVGVLKTLHDELDTAVLAAYGWSDLSLPTDTDTLLQRVVELNLTRFNEETAGLVRWLRPEYQQQMSTEDQQTMDMQNGEETAVPSDKAKSTETKLPVAQVAWPVGLAVQIKAVADALAAAGGALDLEGLALRFNGRGRWRERLPTILDALVALGRALPHDNGGWVDSGR